MFRTTSFLRRIRNGGPFLRRLAVAVLTLAPAGTLRGSGVAPAAESGRAARVVVHCAAAVRAALPPDAPARLAEAPLLRALRATGASADAAPAAAETLPPCGKPEADRAGTRAAGVCHWVVIGTPDADAVCRRVAGFTAGWNRADGARTLTRLGVGVFGGDVGFVETRWNPWLYSNVFDDHPYSTLLITISGTTPAGVRAAFDAFTAGLNNGVVPCGEQTRRLERTILDLEPSAAPPPAALCAAPAGFVYAGWSQPPENEYRAWLEHDAEPERLWRVKFLEPRSLAGADGTVWLRGPALMAWGNARTLARFATPEAAATVLRNLRAASGAEASPWASAPGGAAADAFSVPMPADGMSPGGSPGRVGYFAGGPWVIATSLPETAERALTLPQPQP